LPLKIVIQIRKSALVSAYWSDFLLVFLFVLISNCSGAKIKTKRKTKRKIKLQP